MVRGDRHRLSLELYANVRPIKLLPGVLHGVHGRHREVWDPSKVDLVIVRENTEGLYSGMASASRGVRRMCG